MKLETNSTPFLKHNVTSTLLVAGLALLATRADAQLIGFEAESGASATTTATATLGAEFDPPVADASALGGEYITIELDGAGDSPGSADRVASYDVDFAESGAYDLYGRLWIGADPGVDDSFYYGAGFGSKDPTLGDDWITANGLWDAFEPDGVDTYLWVNLSNETGDFGEDGVTFDVASAGVQTIQVGGREDGLRFDAFAFGATGGTFTALDLDTAVTGTPSNQWFVDGAGSFNEPSNWVANVVPTQDALLGGVLSPNNAPATVTLDSPVSLNSVSFQNTNQYILAGPQTLTLTGDRIVSTGTGAHQITADIAGAEGLVKTGSGTLMLPNANSYTGATDVQGGTLVLNTLDAIDNQASSALNIESESETVILAAGATGALAAELTGIGQLQLSGDLELADAVTVSRSNAAFDGEVFVNGGTLEVVNNNALGVGGFAFNRTLVGGGEATGRVALSGDTTVSNEVLTLEARENAGFDAVHLTSTGDNSWNGNIIGEVGGTQYNIESTSGTLTLGGTITTPDSNDRQIVFSGDGDFSVARISDGTRDVDGNVAGPSADDTISVIKRGSGTLTITTATDDVNDHWLGPTVIEHGALAVTAGASDSGELQSLDVTIREGATLDVSSFGEYSQQIGQVFRGAGEINAGSGTLALFDDGSLDPGDGESQVGTLRVTGDASLSAFAAAGDEGTWSIDLGNGADTSSDRLDVSGEFTASGSPALFVNITPGRGHLDAGAHTIVSHTGGAVAAVNGMTAQITDVQGNPLVTRQTAAVNGNTAGQVNVVVTGEEQARTWNGNVSGAWDMSTSNWQEGDQQFRDLDHVTFDNSASGTTNVTVDGPRFPGSVTFANSTAYTFSGDGGIVGSGPIDITGTGEVTLANTGNNYSGETMIASGSSLRMASASTGSISNAGTLSLGVSVTVDAFTQNSSQEIGANNHKVFAVEAENFVSSTVNNSEIVAWESLADANASDGGALVATPTADNNLDINLANQNFVTYGLKFTEPGEYLFYGRMRGEDSGDGSTADDDSLWLPATNLGGGVTAPQAFSTKYDGDQVSSARNAEGESSGGELFDFDWYISSGQDGGFDRIVVTPADVANGTVFQFGVATRESGAVVDKFVFVQDPDFATDVNFGTITDEDLDGAQVITTTSSETSFTSGNILDVDGDFTMSGDGSVLTMFVGTTDIHDQINVSGSLVADGVLNLESVSGSVVAGAGDVFDIFSFGSASGSFDDVVLPALAGALDWDTSNLLVTGELSIVSTALAGDFNGDGVVDARDYAVWRDNLGAADESALNGGGDGMNGVDTGDYALWRSNFGASPAGTPGTQAVPEPGAIVLLSLSAALVGVRTRRRLTLRCSRVGAHVS